MLLTHASHPDPFRDEPLLLEEIFKTHCLHPSFEKVLKLAQKAPV